ncbi:hypothetical protein TCAL_10406 [Tigriopus californicus]|uniref:Secreted protein n=1 Tax=Tigriopus californicus TaxID=6832 RepID=A0A553PKM1_TIGCA|nr:uncharacterized protein LOC131890550 [Tigriopus californicus]TRY78232.1 hypothetical protein TCAL_10406 [Tigriopus californicus]|eukprot:TCALIF_10406-PA protein Name:"Protein of unknown function" AED:0.00 eAED:0.00 QI:77/1/1/1/1/1/2/141/149
MRILTSVGLFLLFFGPENVCSLDLKHLREPPEILDHLVPASVQNRGEPDKGNTHLFDGIKDLREIAVVGGSDPRGPDDTGNVRHLKCETCSPPKKICLAWTRLAAFGIKICKKHGYPRRRHRRPPSFQIPIIEGSSIPDTEALLVEALD